MPILSASALFGVRNSSWPVKNHTSGSAVPKVIERSLMLVEPGLTCGMQENKWQSKMCYCSIALNAKFICVIVYPSPASQP